MPKTVVFLGCFTQLLFDPVCWVQACEEEVLEEKPLQLQLQQAGPVGFDGSPIASSQWAFLGKLRASSLGLGEGPRDLAGFAGQ